MSVRNPVVPRAALESGAVAPRCMTYGRGFRPPDMMDCTPGHLHGCTTPPAKTRSGVESVGQTGGWKLDPGKPYLLDLGLARAIAAVAHRHTLVELGAGLGCYSLMLAHCGVHVLAAIDGAEKVNELSGGVVTRADLTQPMRSAADWVMTLETGEHIPSFLESVFLNNTADNAHCGVVLSWAFPGQPGIGHVNTRPQGYVVAQMASRGFKVDANHTQRLRRAASLWFLQRNVLVFTRIAPSARGRACQPPDFSLSDAEVNRICETKHTKLETQQHVRSHDFMRDARPTRRGHEVAGITQ